MQEYAPDIFARLSAFTGIAAEALANSHHTMTEAFERLTAYDLCRKSVPDFTADQARDAVLGGLDDKQTDCIAIFLNNEYVASDEDLESTGRLQDITSVAIIVTQATIAQRYQEAKMVAAVMHASQLFEPMEGINENQKRANRRAQIHQILAAVEQAANEPAFQVLFYFVGLSNEWEGQDRLAMRRVVDFRAMAEMQFRRYLKPYMNWAVEVYDLGRYRELILAVEEEGQRRQRSNQRVIANAAMVPLAGGPNIKGGFIGVVPARDFVTLLERADGLGLMDDLDRFNVRSFLSEQTAVNSHIGSALDGAARDEFAFFNNGVVIVADDAKFSEGELALKNYHIVNGLQTSMMLYSRRHLFAELANKTCVIVKVVIVTQDEARLAISRSSNRQTAITGLTIEVDQTLLGRISDALAVVRDQHRGFRIYLETKEGQLDDLNDRGAIVFTRDDLIRAMGATFIRRPHAAAAGAMRLASLVPQTLLNPDHPVEPYVIATRLQDIADKYLEGQQRIPRNFRFHLSYGLFVLLHRMTPPKDLTHPDVPEACKQILRRMADERGMKKAIEAASGAVSSVLKNRSAERGLETREKDFTRPLAQSLLARRKDLKWHDH